MRVKVIKTTHTFITTAQNLVFLLSLKVDKTEIGSVTS